MTENSLSHIFSKNPTLKLKNFISIKSPDDTYEDYETCRGEFSIKADMAFEDHLKSIYAYRFNG